MMVKYPVTKKGPYIFEYRGVTILKVPSKPIRYRIPGESRAYLSLGKAKQAVDEGKQENPGLMTALLEGAAGAVGGAVIEELRKKTRNPDSAVYWVNTQTRGSERQLTLRKAVSRAKYFANKYGEFVRVTDENGEVVEEVWPKARINPSDPSDRYVDLLRQGFMKQGRSKPKKPKFKVLDYKKDVVYETDTLTMATATASNLSENGTIHYVVEGKKVLYKYARGKLINPGLLKRAEKFLGFDDESKARKLASAFHGRPNREVYEFEVEDVDEKHLAHLGELTELHIKDKKGRLFTITFDERPILASTVDANQLVFVGGDQELDLDDRVVQSGNMFVDGENIKGKRLIPIGEVQRIDYFADKHHLSGPKSQKDGVEYKHEFGEEDGNLPILMYNPKAERMMLSGGNYRVLDVGISN